MAIISPQLDDLFRFPRRNHQVWGWPDAIDLNELGRILADFDPTIESRGLVEPDGFRDRDFRPLRRARGRRSTATAWAEVYPEFEVVPLMKASPGIIEGDRAGQSSGSPDGWVPLDEPWREGDLVGDLDRLYQRKAGLGIGLRLGPIRAGGPRLVELAVANHSDEERVLKRLLGTHLPETFRWRDDRGLHLLLIGDGRLDELTEAYERRARAETGHAPWPGVTLRLGGTRDGSGGAFALLPPIDALRGPSCLLRAVESVKALPEAFYGELADALGLLPDSDREAREDRLVKALIAIKGEREYRDLIHYRVLGTVFLVLKGLHDGPWVRWFEEAFAGIYSIKSATTYMRVAEEWDRVMPHLLADRQRAAGPSMREFFRVLEALDRGRETPDDGEALQSGRRDRRPGPVEGNGHTTGRGGSGPGAEIDARRERAPSRSGTAAATALLDEPERVDLEPLDGERLCARVGELLRLTPGRMDVDEVTARLEEVVELPRKVILMERDVKRGRRRAQQIRDGIMMTLTREHALMGVEDVADLEP